jgi:hypothetical protein
MLFNQSATSVAASISYVYPTTVAHFKALDYGPSDFDHRSVSSVSYVYVLPTVLAESPASLRYVINGWDATGLFQFHSGDPLIQI